MQIESEWIASYTCLIDLWINHNSIFNFISLYAIYLGELNVLELEKDNFRRKSTQNKHK